MIKQSSLLALAVCAGISQMAFAESVTDQADAKGFVEGSSITGLLRNYYFDRDRQSGKADNRDWTQGAMLNYASGFTQGTIGFGVDAYAYGGVKLDATHADAGTGDLPTDRHGDPENAYGSVGAAVKIKVSKTELKFGDMQPTALAHP